MLPELATDNGSRALARSKRLSRKREIHHQSLEGRAFTHRVECVVREFATQTTYIAICECPCRLPNNLERLERLSYLAESPEKLSLVGQGLDQRAANSLVPG